jgi:hypothetical protein
MMSKIKLTSYSVAFIICMLLLVFNLTPLAPIEQLFTAIMSVIGAVLFVGNHKKFHKLFKHWLFVFLSLGVLSTFTNTYIHKTSLLSGFIGSIAYFKVLALVPLYMLIKNEIYLVKTIQYLLKLGVLFFLIILIIFVFDIKFFFYGFASDAGLEVSAAKLNKTFINFTAFLLLGGFFILKQNKYLLYAILLFSANMFGDFQRWVFISFFGALLIGFFIQKNVSLKLRLIPLAMIALLTIIMVMNYSSYGDFILTKFIDAFALFSESRISQDSSVNARGWQTEFALNGFFESPIIGNGVFRNSVKEDLFGDVHFYLSDIGVVGLLYAFGIVGPLVYIFQIKTALKMTKYSVLNMGLKLFMIFLLIFSILTGSSILKPTIFMVVILLYVKSKQFENLSVSEGK